MKYKLKRDIVIKKGTVFTQAPRRVDRDENFTEAVIGLSTNTVGYLTYDVSRETFKEVSKYFKVVKE
jgi:glucose uptake protein GlcU